MDRSICQGSPADLTQLVDTLSSAFQHDPALSWILPDPAQKAAKESNVALYLKLGFKVVGEWDVPEGGPHFWSMLCKN